jgi:hypothetical protein
MPDPIHFDVFNPQTPAAGPVIYISDDPDKWGRLTLVLSNTRTDNSDIKLDPGAVLQVYFEMLTPDDIGNIKLPDGSDWAGGPVDANRHVELKPKAPITLPPNASIEIELHGVLGRTSRQGKFRFYEQSLGIKNAVVQGFVQRPPGETPKAWPLNFVLDPRQEYQNRGDTVYVTASGKAGLANFLLLHLYCAVGTIPSAGSPQISVGFLTGNAPLALCSDEAIKGVTASIAQQIPGDRWNSPGTDDTSEDRVWNIAPVAGGGDLFAEDGLLMLRFDNIVTGLAPGPATLYIHCTGLNGYDDSHFQQQLTRTEPVPCLRYFRARANGNILQADATTDFVPLSLEWDVFAADGCLLQGDDEPQAAPVGLAGNKPLVARPFQKYTPTPVVGNVGYFGWDLQFHVTKPVASLTTAPDRQGGKRSWVLSQWSCYGTASDNRGVLGNMEGRTFADVPLTHTARFNGRDMLGTGVQTYAANVSFSEPLDFKRTGGNSNDGGVEVNIAVGPPLLSWNCRNGDHCVLYENGTKILDGLPLAQTMPAKVNTSYEIECIGAGSDTSTVTTPTTQEANASFSVAYGDAAVMNWSVTGGQRLQVTDGPAIVSTDATGTYTDPYKDRAYGLDFSANDVDIGFLAWRPNWT